MPCPSDVTITITHKCSENPKCMPDSVTTVPLTDLLYEAGEIQAHSSNSHDNFDVSDAVWEKEISKNGKTGNRQT